MKYTEFEGRIAVVTGGSDGLGYDFCRGLIEAGCRVYFCARNAERGLAAERTLGERARFIRADLTDEAQVASLAREVGEREGRVDYLVNNAAVDDRIAFDDVTSAEAERMWRINLLSHILVTRAFLDLIRAGEGKAVVNLGTTNYTLGLAPFTLYNAAKCGLVGFTRSFAREMGPEGIRANMVSPGWIMTKKQLDTHVTEQDRKDLLRDQALKWLLHAEHVTPAVLFLLSDDARAITGQNLTVDNGKVME